MQLRHAVVSLSSALLTACFVLLLVPVAQAHVTETIDFDSLAPGTSFFDAQIEGLRVSTPSAAPIEVHPGATVCAPPVSCGENGTPHIVAAVGHVIRIERADGGRFKLVQLDTRGGATQACSWTAWVAGDPTPLSGTIGCTTGVFQTRVPSSPLAGTAIVAIEITKPDTQFQLDNVVVEPLGPPADVTLVSDDRSLWVGGTQEIWGPLWEFEGCTDAVTRDFSPAPPFSDFDVYATESLGVADQDSIVSPSRLAAVGMAQGDSFHCWGFGTSTYDVSFTVASHTLAHLHGTLHDGTGVATASLMRDGQTLWTFGGWDNPTTLHEETVLTPGDYRLLVVADTNGWTGGWEATYDVELDLSAIEAVPGLGPVAQGALSLALTLSALGAHARRKRIATSNR